MKKYDYILFDLDDTLIDNLENVRHAYKKMLEYVGVDYTEEGFKKWLLLDTQYWLDFGNKKIDVPLEYQTSQELFVKYVRSLRYMKYLEGKISLNDAFIINDIYLQALNEVVVPICGAYETLEYLHDKYKLVITTNGPTLAVEPKLRKINCLAFFDYIFSSDMTKKTVTKPNREYFWELQNFLNYYKNNRMLIVGDSLKTDIKGGMNAGIDSCWFNPRKEELPIEYSPTMVISDLQELTRKL